MQEDFQELETALGHVFARRGLLVRALTHRSRVHEQLVQAQQEEGHEPPITPGDNERLEFLGDAVLGLVVGEALFQLHPEWHEGELTRVRSLLVSRHHLGQVAESIDLGKFMLLSKGEDRSGLRRKSTVLSNGMEAVMGALYLDGGLDSVRTFVRRQVMGETAKQLAEEVRSGAALGNYKSALQERLQAEHTGTPVYRVKSESGPDHRKKFLVEVRLKAENNEPGKMLARGTGSTKKNAEQDAARRALQLLDRIAAKNAAVEEDDENADDSGQVQP
ncbi:ribonuclease III [Telmatobacter bradus]|uniref:ribonuclease III n=1 Tax=Telmatobacter bradus TaxID=474953 RepID=UPI003B428AFE